MRGDPKTCAPFRDWTQLCYRKSSTVAFYWIMAMGFSHHPAAGEAPEMWIGALHRSCDHRSDECDTWDGIGHRLAFENGAWVPEPGFFETCTSLD